MGESKGLPVSIALMIIGAIVFVYALFTSYSEPEQGFNLTNYSSIDLPPLHLSSLEKRDIVVNIPYVRLTKDDNEKEYSFELKRKYNYFEAFYQIEEDRNAKLDVYINDFLVSFNKYGDGYYKYLDKSIIKDHNLDIRFVLEKEGFSLFSTPEIVVKDFLIYGYYTNNEASISFNLDKIEELTLDGKPLNCEPGQLTVQVNDCPAYAIDFNCKSRITYDVSPICLKKGYNVIKFKLNSGKLDLYDLKLIKVNSTQ